MQWHIHVLAPCAETDRVPVQEQTDYHLVDENLLTEWSPKFVDYVDAKLRLVDNVADTQWHYTSFGNYEAILSSIKAFMSITEHEVIVLSLMDGQETDGWPGQTVIKALELTGLPFTGAGSLFYEMDVSKASMKAILAAHCPLLTPKYLAITSHDKENVLMSALTSMQFPVIVKPNKSSGSRGITQKSIVYNLDDAFTVASQLAAEYDGAYLEEFVRGLEFTCLVTGDYSTGIRTYKPVQRVFASNVPQDQQFLSFEMKWQLWSKDPGAGSWWYASPQSLELQNRIMTTAEQVYRSLGANGYARMDFRLCSKTDRLLVVDVNANCSIDGEDDSGLGVLLKSDGLGLEDLLKDILQYALARKKVNDDQFN